MFFQLKTKGVASDTHQNGRRAPASGPSLYSRHNGHDTVSDSPSGFHDNGRGNVRKNSLSSFHHNHNANDSVSDPPSGFHGNGDGVASHPQTHKSHSQSERLLEINDCGQSAEPVQPQQVVEPTADWSKESNGQYSLKQLDEPEVAPSSELELVKCNLCNRSFLHDRLEKHYEICIKNAAAPKRIVFDATKMRVQGTEFAPYVYTKKKREIPASRKVGCLT